MILFKTSKRKLSIQAGSNCVDFDGLKIGMEAVVTRKSGFTKNAFWLNMHLIFTSIVVHYVEFG